MKNAERLARERQAAEVARQEQLAQERLEAERKAKEEADIKAREEADRLERERLEAERKPKSNKSPFLAALFSFLIPGTGQIYVGQWKKGLVLLVSFYGSLLLLTVIFIGYPLAMIIAPISIGDGYGVAQKLRRGIPMGEWKFSINWIVVGIMTFIYIIFYAIMMVIIYTFYNSKY